MTSSGSTGVRVSVGTKGEVKRVTHIAVCRVCM